MYRHFFKRLIDILVSGTALIILAIPLGIIALWLHFANNGAGVIFTQERPGLHGKIFKIYKFKTMTDERDDEGKLLPPDQRLTKTGILVRHLSLDELPQLWNVFIGDMSLIGPRPLLVRYLPLYSKEQMRRHDVRPGITGWAQCHGRNQMTWKQKFEYDVWYVDNLSFKTDLKVIYTTIYKVLKHEGIDSEDGKIVEDFNGHN